jgi:hypothetical protein
MSLQTSNATLTTPFPGLSGIVALHPKTEKTVRFTMVSSATSSNRDPWSSSGWVEEEDDGDIVPKTELIDDVADFLDTKESEATSSTPIVQVKQPRGRPRKHPKPTAETMAKVAKGRPKTGCITCRRRKKKCDETKPSCK